MLDSTPSQHYLSGSIVYFFLFASYGCIMPFMPLIWRSKGLSEHQVGLLGSVKPFISFFVTPVACSFADKHGAQRQMLLTSLITFPTSLSAVMLANNFISVLTVELASATAGCPIGTLLDSFVIASAGTDGYGYQRLWGAFGFGFASLLGGYIFDAMGGRYWGEILLFVCFMATTFIASTTLSMGRADTEQEHDDSGAGGLELPATVKKTALASMDPSPAADKSDTIVLVTAVNSGNSEHGEPKNDGKVHEMVQKDGGGSPRGEVMEALRVMFGSGERASFFAAVGLSGMGSGVIDTFLFIWLKDLGGTHAICGIARLIMCLAEVPFFFLSGPLIRRIGVRGVIALAQVAYLTRFVYYSVLEEPVWVFPAEVLHGLTFAAMWTATRCYAQEIAPAELHSTIQGFVTGIHWGFGVGLGAIMGGVIYAGLGARACFSISTVLPFLSLTLLTLPTLQRCQPRGLASIWWSKPTSATKYQRVDKASSAIRKTLFGSVALHVFVFKGVADDMKADDENIASGDLTDHYLDAAIATLTAKAVLALTIIYTGPEA